MRASPLRVMILMGGPYANVLDRIIRGLLSNYEKDQRKEPVKDLSLNIFASGVFTWDGKGFLSRVKSSLEGKVAGIKHIVSDFVSFSTLKPQIIYSEKKLPFSRIPDWVKQESEAPALPRPEGVNYSIKINFLTLSREEQEQRILNPPKSSKVVAVKESSTLVKQGGGGEKPQELTEENSA